MKAKRRDTKQPRTSGGRDRRRRQERPAAHGGRAPNTDPSDEYPGRIAQRLRAIALGEKEPGDAAAKRHHFISQTQLSRFEAPDLDGDRLWQLDRHSGRVVGMRIDEAASRKHLYRAETPDGGTTNVLEWFLGLIEFESRDSVESLLSQPGSVSAAERADLGFLIAAQWLRTPSQQRRLRSFAELEGRLDIALRLANGTLYTDDAIAQHPDAVDEVTRSFLSGDVEVRAANEKAFETLLQLIAPLAASLADLEWSLHRSITTQLAIGDIGVCWFDPSPTYPWNSPAPASSPNSYGLLPLSATVCLRIGASPNTGCIAEHRGDRLAEKSNRLAYAYSERHVFAGDRTTLVELYADAQAHPERYPAAPRDAQTLVEPCDPSDPTVGLEHPSHWPRYIWIPHEQDPDEMVACSYEVIYTEDDRVPDFRGQ